MNPGSPPAAVIHAQASLEVACGALDTAIEALAENTGETVMANTELVALLLRVVEAQRRLAEIARPRLSSPPASFR